MLSRSRTDTVERLRQASSGVAMDLRGADLRQANLGGLVLTRVSLEGCCFDGANLEGARLTQVELTNASFCGAALTDAWFDHDHGVGVAFDRVHAEGSHWRGCTLVGARFDGSRLRRASFSGCDLDSSVFDDADLTLASLLRSRLDRASLSGARLRKAETLGVSLVATRFERAREFAYCRELVVEALLRGIDLEDVEQSSIVGAIQVMRMACYPAWANLLRSQPRHIDLAREIFGRYPASGCLEALEAALARVREPEAAGVLPG